MKHNPHNPLVDPPRISIEYVTPEMAAQMLGTMHGNRALRQAAVKKYAREMTTGAWLLNGEAIKFAKDGRLIDGQHRLSAVMMAKVTVAMTVVRGVDAGAMVTLDTGVGRTFGDVNTIAGRAYAQACGPVCRWWFKYVLGSPTVSTIQPTHQELMDVLQTHPGIADSVAFILSLKTVHRRCNASVQAFVHSYVAEKYDREMADLFMRDLNEGADLKHDSPIYTLRKKLVDDAPASGRGRLESSHVLAWTIKAWNAWAQGVPLKVIKWQTGGEKPEEFPRFDIDRNKPKLIGTRKKVVRFA